MPKLLPALLLAASLLTPSARAADRPWQHLSNPTTADLAAGFAHPPSQNSLTLTWGWSGEVTPAIITQDLDYMHDRGVLAATIECGRVTNAPYLTPAYFQLVKTAVAEAKKRSMHLWFINESKYPSGFAGGKFTAERPDLRMQVLVLGEHFTAATGDTIARDLSPDIIAAVATNQAGANTVLEITNNKLHWTALEGTWTISLIGRAFRTAPTRSSTSPTGAKDTQNSLMDYLNPAAVKQFLTWTEEQYKAAVGDEFGQTILGFRGDEPEYPEGGCEPWTPALFDEFQKRKGYDIRPWLPAVLGYRTTDDMGKRAHADYVDVWSDLFGENYFGQESAWCAANNMDFQVHIDHEERQMTLIRSDGDYFKCMRGVSCPGIDTIQNQITPGKIADFPKFASSSAHLSGHPTCMCEAFAAYANLDVPGANWVVNHLLVRGVNRFEFMFFPSGSGARAGRGYLGSPDFPKLVAHTNRAAYVLSQGRPAAQIALYTPTTSFWLGDANSYQSFLTAAQTLLENQRDADFIDEYALTQTLKLENGQLTNLSGQAYKAIIIPQCPLLSQVALATLKSFAAAGGKVIFLGAGPTLTSDKNILRAPKPTNISWATLEPTAKLTPEILASLPKDFFISAPIPSIKYIHRHLADAELYFIFNESDQKQSCDGIFLAPPNNQPIESTHPPACQTWDTVLGKATDVLPQLMNGSPHNISITMKLEMEPGASKIVVIANIKR